jgi:hypothetical protein
METNINHSTDRGTIPANDSNGIDEIGSKPNQHIIIIIIHYYDNNNNSRSVISEWSYY